MRNDGDDGGGSEGYNHYSDYITTDYSSLTSTDEEKNSFILQNKTKSLSSLILSKDDLKIKEKLKQTRGIHLLGESDSGLVSFYSTMVHALDLATYLDSRHIAVRSGHLCAQPALARYKVKQVVRISTGAYTTCEDIDIALNALHEALVFFS